MQCIILPIYVGLLDVLKALADQQNISGKYKPRVFDVTECFVKLSYNNDGRILVVTEGYILLRGIYYLCLD